jgi:capsular exopolysaccharide synthesis family protein
MTIRRYAGLLRKRRWMLVSIVAVGVTASVVYTLCATKIYEASATIVVNPQSPRVNKDDEVIELGAGSFAYNREYYNTQIEVLTSFPLAHATVVQGESPKFYERLAPASEYPKLNETKRIGRAAELLIDMLKAVQHRESRVIAIQVRDRDPALAQALANTHVASYMAFMRGKRTVGTGQASQVLSIQLDDARKLLTAAEAKITSFKAQHDLITQSFDDKQNTVVSELQRYSAALADAKVKRIELAALRGRAQSLSTENVFQTPIFGLVSNTSHNNDVVDQLKAEYVRATQHFVEVDVTYGPKSGEHKTAKDMVDQLYAQLQGEASRVMREIEERYQAAVAAEVGYEQLVTGRRKDAEELDKLYAEYAPLVRDQKFAEDQYSKLSTRLGSSRQEGQNDLINVEPHEMAREAYLVLPRMKVNVALAVFVSLLLGVGLTFGLEHLDRTIKSADGIEALVGAPLLGIIPMVTDVPAGDESTATTERDLYVLRHPTSQAAECCRSIRTNILFASAERQMTTITVSSPRPREGKTTTTLYLGTTMAQSGQRVLLIDTDLRRPRLHKSLAVPKDRGLTNLLLGDTNYDEIIRPTDLPNLFVLPCGPQPPNPAELLLTKRFKVILDELGQRFDRILLDSPPILAATDAVLLGKITDGVILVAQAGKTYTDDVTMAVRQLRDVGAPILGVILNVTNVSDRRYGHYYYAYGGYGDRTTAEATGADG